MMLDFGKPKLTKTEKAVEMLQAQLNGLQRQIAGICIEKGISPQRFADNTHKDNEINTFLQDTQQAEQILVNAINKANVNDKTEKFSANSGK